MLAELFIQNFALIEEVRIDFQPGFNVLTGETGAGKSIILDATAVPKTLDASLAPNAHPRYNPPVSGNGIGGIVKPSSWQP